MSNKTFTPTRITPATYFAEYIFAVDKDDDPFWVAIARDYVCACILDTQKDKTISQLLKLFSITGDKNVLKSYQKFDKYKTINNQRIKAVVELPDDSKLNVFKVIQQKIDAYLKARNMELEKSYDFFAQDGLYETTIECWFKELYKLQNAHAGETMICGEVVKPLTYTNLVEQIKKLPSGLSEVEKNRTLQSKISEQIKFITRETDIKVYNRYNFQCVKYKYYLEYGSTINKSVKMFRVSPTKFAMLAKGSTILCVIDDKEKTKRLYKQFKEFVKKAPRWKPEKRSGFVGLVCDMWWSGGLWFAKKQPEPSATCEYLTGVFKQNGFDIDGIFAQTNEVVKELNKHSKLDYTLGADYDRTISEKLVANGYQLVRNYMSHDYTLTSGKNTTFVSFAGYPNDETEYHLTRYAFNKKGNHLYGIKVGTSLENAEQVLEHFGYEKFAGNYVNKKVIVTLKAKQGEIQKIEVRLQSDYLGNRIY